ncbi:MAG: head-tail adaptor protein [Pseudomonadota bacterium]
MTRARQAGTLRERIAFDAPLVRPDGFGGQEAGFVPPTEAVILRCEMIFERGSESVEAARLSGRSRYKLRTRNGQSVRRITTDWRARHLPDRGTYAVVEADTVTDRAWAWLVIESGVSA